MFAIGDKIAGQTIREILGQSSKAIVYVTEDNQLRWHYLHNDGDIPEYLTESIRIFDQLMQEIGQYVEKNRRKITYETLGKALFSALNCGDSVKRSEIIDIFKLSKDAIAESSRKRISFNYTISGISAFLFISVVVFLIDGQVIAESNKIYIYMILSGAAGSAVSIMQRSGNIKLDYRQSLTPVWLEGGCRIIVGAIFSIVLMFASKANLAFGFISEVTEGLMVFGFISGFSERFLPELLKGLTSEERSDKD